jgi:hypothetical protein
MKKILIAICCLAAVSAKAQQTADDVVQKYTAAMGGLDAFNKISSVKMTGNISTQGMDLPLTIQIVNGKGMRSDVEVPQMGQTITSAYSNDIGWKINPLQGSSTPTKVTGTELNELKSQATLATQLMDYKARGHKLELLGEETLDGAKVAKIKLTNKDDGKITTYFIGTKDNLLIKSVSIKEVQGNQTEISTVYSDLKDFGGIKFSMTRSMQMNGEEFQAIVFSNIELNAKIDEKIFVMP